MTRVAIYARFSSDKQNDASTDDQVRICRDRAAAEGWDVVATFADKAISGATRDRPQLNLLLARAAEFDIVLAESIDRLSRDQEDIAAIHKRLRFAGVSIVTLADGAVGEIHIGLKGTMAALFLADLGQKTRRGQIGRVAAGRIPGGLCYGYKRRLDQLDGRGEIERGLREIDAGQAAVVQRIFAEFTAGDSPRTIVLRLNREKVPSPAGGLWRANALTGSRTRRNGILYNDLYSGRIVYNRQRFIRDPETRKRVSRPNPPAEWKVQEVPELRIVDEPVWAAAQARLDGAAGVPAHRQRRAQKLFSGLLVCGECGGSYTSVGNGYWQCSTQRQTGTCGNNRTIADKALEARVLGAMSEQLLHPDAVRRVVAAYHRRRADNRRKARDGRHELEQRLEQVDRGIKRLVAVIADEDMADVAELQVKIREAKAEREALRAALADMDAEATLPLHPGIEAVFRQQFANLAEALQGGGAKRDAAKAGIRALIDHIRVTPRAEGKGVDLDLAGRLAEMLNIEKGRPDRDGLEVDFTAKVVAGARIGRCSTIARLSIARC